jgi:hypothetical protein
MEVKSGDIDKVFERLRRADYATVIGAIYDLDRAFYVNPMTFETKVNEMYHHIIHNLGWSVDNFEFELNYN